MDQLDPTTNEVAEEAQKIIGPDGEPMVAKWLTLGVEKFDRPEKHYRLIWIWRDQAWLAEEETRCFRRKYGEGGAVEAGRALAERVKCLVFSEAAR